MIAVGVIVYRAALVAMFLAHVRKVPSMPRASVDTRIRRRDIESPRPSPLAADRPPCRTA
ncbi:hypothetical protein I545_2040 [Mycobacterium kansasii 662]|uniref:Uncharacterized protein n=2 Tax=Mycobacterium kansasii TaxID=1768 RepID=A0A1V3XPA4_MYCKA|nr:hypothetical protein I547_3878 [Mycobacterium kansasii 824]EUA20215.1 hypothetical protein I545_2040 [Mycobacterium kansasii 662]KEP40027.1 hypothetical protein MKSMC1_48380 [Mycobacterium kansasii]OOK78412.1 hypothetical protein BZL30_2248 [Mycobacterium kansasii]OOK81035.1 hypothetical protein BZL29_2239 [Mycobacterium kansasii]